MLELVVIETSIHNLACLTINQLNKIIVKPLSFSISLVNGLSKIKSQKQVRQNKIVNYDTSINLIIFKCIKKTANLLLSHVNKFIRLN